MVCGNSFHVGQGDYVKFPTNDYLVEQAAYDGYNFDILHYRL
jgi:hypothetical protein